MQALPQDIIKYEIFPSLTYKEIGLLYRTHKMFRILTKEEYEGYKDQSPYIVRYKQILKNITPYKYKGSCPILTSGQLKYINNKASFEQLVEIIRTMYPYFVFNTYYDDSLSINNNPQMTHDKDIIHLRILKNTRQDMYRGTHNLVYDLNINIHLLIKILAKEN